MAFFLIATKFWGIISNNLGTEKLFKKFFSKSFMNKNLIFKSNWIPYFPNYLIGYLRYFSQISLREKKHLFQMHISKSRIIIYSFSKKETVSRTALCFLFFFKFPEIKQYRSINITLLYIILFTEILEVTDSRMYVKNDTYFKFL